MPHAARFRRNAIVDDWIEIGKPGKLTTLVKRYVKHLGQDSYVALW